MSHNYQVTCLPLPAPSAPRHGTVSQGRCSPSVDVQDVKDRSERCLCSRSAIITLWLWFPLGTSCYVTSLPLNRPDIADWDEIGSQCCEWCYEWDGVMMIVNIFYCSMPIFEKSVKGIAVRRARVTQQILIWTKLFEFVGDRRTPFFAWLYA